MKRPICKFFLKMFLPAIFCVVMVSCKTRPVIPYPSDGKSAEKSQIISSRHISKVRRSILKEAEEWLGTPYKYAGAEKNVGADCSGMVLRVFESATSIKLPRNSAKQSEFCHKLKSSEVLPGDLVFFATGKLADRVTHVGIMLDNDSFIHSSSSRGVVVSSVSTPYYRRTFICYGRVPQLD